jgi:hypothetical protein
MSDVVWRRGGALEAADMVAWRMGGAISADKIVSDEQEHSDWDVDTASTLE